MVIKDSDDRMLTDTELEMMRVIWTRGRATAGEVQEALSSERELAYTSVSTILRILEQKQVLRSEKVGRGHVYVPMVEREEYESRSVKHLVKDVFDGDGSALIKRMIDDKGLTQTDLRELHELLEKRIKG